MRQFLPPAPDEYTTFDAARQLEALGWFLPPYFPLGRLRQIAYALATLPETERLATLDALLPALYPPQETASMLMNCYTAAPHLRHEVRRIEEALTAFYGGRYIAATCAALPAIESAIRSVSTNAGMHRTQAFLDVLDGLYVGGEKTRETVEQERMTIVRGIRTFFADHLYLPTQGGKRTPYVNRHALIHGLHGVGPDATAAGFCRVLSMIDALCFSLAIHRGVGGAMLRPSPTPESERLAAYFQTHTALARLRPS
jgi:hypothetical protein